MSRKTTKRPRRERWRDRAEKMLALAQAMPDPEARAQMERLAADWLLIAAAEDERQRPAHDRRIADMGTTAASDQTGGGAGHSSSK
jgi:hypothetical protein